MALTLLLLASCATHPPVVVRAAQDFQCPEGEIDTRDLGNGGWRAEGCGQMAIYDCQATDGGSQTICVKQ